jgi:hypothetical protein
MRDTIMRDAVMVGGMDALMERVLDTPARADALALLDEAAQAVGQIEAHQEREQELRVKQIKYICDQFEALGRRMDAFIARRKEKARKDAEEEQARIQRMLDAMPDPDASGHTPSGDLHSLPAPEDPEGAMLEQDQQGVSTRPVVDPEDLAHAPFQPNQPTSISLMSED